MPTEYRVGLVGYLGHPSYLVCFFSGILNGFLVEMIGRKIRRFKINFEHCGNRANKITKWRRIRINVGNFFI